MISQIVRAAFAVAVILLGVMTPMVMPQSGQSTVDPSIVPSLLLSKRSQPIAFAQDDDDDNDDGDNSDDDDDDDNDDGDR